MKTTIGLGMLGVLLAAGGQDVTELIRKDRDRLQGKWKVIAAESKGERVPAKELGAIFLVFDGDTIQVQEDGNKQDRYTYRLTPDRDPRQVDFIYTQGKKKGRTDRGIYIFKGERVTFCIQEDANGPRPKAFATDSANGLALVILERVPRK